MSEIPQRRASSRMLDGEGDSRVESSPNVFEAERISAQRSLYTAHNGSPCSESSDGSDWEGKGVCRELVSDLRVAFAQQLTTSRFTSVGLKLLQCSQRQRERRRSSHRGDLLR